MMGSAANLVEAARRYIERTSPPSRMTRQPTGRTNVNLDGDELPRNLLRRAAEQPSNF